MTRASLAAVRDEDGFASRLLGAIREETGCPSLEYASAACKIPSGHEADVYALELSGGPSDSRGPLIARCFGDVGTGRPASLEASIHEGLLAQGFPVPRVVAARDAPPSFLLMERLPGRAMADGIEFEPGLVGRVAALWNLARLSTRLPTILGEMTARLLALDAEPVLQAMKARGLEPEEIGFERHLESIAERVERGAFRGHEPGLHWLQQERPSAVGQPAICHGDMAPNLLFDPSGITGVIDWSSAFVAVTDPAFEIANTRVMIEVPLPFPGGIRQLSAAYQRGLVQRYHRALGERPDITPERLRYYEAWRSFRSLLGAAEVWQACAEGARFPERPDPWTLPEVAPRVAERFRATTGITVSMPDPPSV